MARKVFTVITLTLAILVLCILIVLAVAMVLDYKTITNTQGTSGIDYLHFLFYPVFFGALSLTGIAFSGICLMIAKNRTAKITACILTMIFVFIIFSCLLSL